MSVSEVYARWRYRLIPDHVLGEILSKNWIDNAIPAFILLISLVVFAALIPDFFSVYGLTDNGRQLGELMFVVLGMTLVMLAGGIDLSVGSNFALTTFLSLGMFNALGWPVPIVVLGSMLVGGAVGLVNGILVGYLVGRTKFVGRRAMELISMLNYALPGTIVGIAYLLAFNDKPLALTGTATILIACYIFRYSPTGIRTTIALLQQIDKSMEEASASLGANSFVTFRRIMLPLLLPAFFAGLGVVFIRSMTAISATIFLVSINWALITVKILENMTEVALGPAAAFSVFVIVVVLVVTGLLNAVLRRMTAPSLRVSRIGT